MRAIADVEAKLNYRGLVTVLAIVSALVSCGGDTAALEARVKKLEAERAHLTIVLKNREELLQFLSRAGLGNGESLLHKDGPQPQMEWQCEPESTCVRSHRCIGENCRRVAWCGDKACYGHIGTCTEREPTARCIGVE